MIKNYLGQQIKANFSYKPTLEQENAIKKLADFLFTPKMDEIFLHGRSPQAFFSV